MWAGPMARETSTLVLLAVAPVAACVPLYAGAARPWLWAALAAASILAGIRVASSIVRDRIEEWMM